MVKRGISSELADFHPAIQGWFRDRFPQVTPAQALGWPAIRRGKNTLIAAPTGSGKTLAAFLVCIDRLFRCWEEGRLENRPYVVYISPLKALGNDIHRNLEIPLAEIRQRTPQRNGELPPILSAVRSGDTPPAERQRMLRRPPHLLVTTPESLYLLVTSPRGRTLLSGVEAVIVDEIHALARDKRGSHLALTLARLDTLPPRPPVRIGLSATQRPIDEIARYLVGTGHVSLDGVPDCQVVDIGHSRELDLAVEVPASPLEAVCSNEQWDEVYEQLVTHIQCHRSTLVFVNTRRLAERIAHRLSERLGKEAVASHHGSLARQIRLRAEQQLKSGTLRAIVATASLEMGIDVGTIDLVCQIGSPRAIATFLQRVGRSGHSVGAIPRGRLFPLTRDELLECLALTRAVRSGRLDAIEVPSQPLDILAQQIVAEVAGRDCTEDELYQLCRSAWPYRQLSRADFQAIVQILTDGITPTHRRGRYLYRDRARGLLRARRGARLTALTSGGAIPETAQFRVVTVDDETYVGDVDEDFAIESSSGDIFLLGSSSWKIASVREGKVLVHDAHGAPPTVPFWFGEAPGRTNELSGEISQLRQAIHDRLPGNLATKETSSVAPDAVEWLSEHCSCSASAGQQAVQYVAAQKLAVGMVPTARQILFERFFDESGGMQLVIHAPLGSRINRAWGFALRKRFCRSFDFELQAAATDDGIVLSIGPQHSFPIESLFQMVHPNNGRYLLEQAVLAVPMFQTRWRWTVTRALIVPRFQAGKKVPFYLQRYRADDLLAAVFPATVGCLENHEGDVEIPGHPLVRQTMLDCLHEAMDLDGWTQVLEQIRAGDIELVAKETREPSPFSHQLLNANPYAFLDGAALEERRTRAVTSRKGLPLEQLRDLAQLHPTAIDRCIRDAAPTIRDADELHEWLRDAVVLLAPSGTSLDGGIPQIDPTDPLLRQLMESGRAYSLTTTDGGSAWSATEQWPLIQAIFPHFELTESVRQPMFDRQVTRGEALRVLLQSWLGTMGPVTASRLAAVLGVARSEVSAALEGLEATGVVMRGHFRTEGETTDQPLETPVAEDANELQWCDRILLARIHRLTLDRLREQIEPVDRATFVRFCLNHHRLNGGDSWGGAAAVRETIASLQGIDAPASAWESTILPGRVPQYEEQWLDQLFATGEAVWGRLRPPKQDASDRHWSSPLTRSISIGLILREDLDWLLPPGPRMAIDRLRSDARLTYDVLATRGALFWQQLLSATGLLNAQLESALRELAATGLITCDSFSAVRQLIAAPTRHRRGTSKRRMRSIAGRWSLFADSVANVPREEATERWARQLLRRWGVVFRDLLAREPAAPRWAELFPIYRQWEYRGEVRGGRFVRGVAGVQFATPQAVSALRQRRDDPADTSCIVISATDPLNMVGILDQDDDRIPSITGNALALRNGQCVAWKVGDTVHVAPELPDHDAQLVTRALCRAPTRRHSDVR